MNEVGDDSSPILCKVRVNDQPVTSGGLAKACVPGKNCFVPEKIEFLIEYQTE